MSDEKIDSQRVAEARVSRPGAANSIRGGKMMNYRNIRGGSHDFDSRYLRTADRYRDTPVIRSRNGGFRLVVRR